MTKDNKKIEKYTYATGRRKTSIARVRIYEGKKSIIVNDKDYKDYFANNNVLIEKVIAPLKLLKLEDKFGVVVKISGGGPTGQAEAIRLGISRALLSTNENYKLELKAQGYLTRDPREVERKKPGLKKARKAPQWKKR